MSKRNIAYVKLEEPSFLRKLKEQVGYKEGPTVDTKRQDLGVVDDEDFQDTEEEQPTVVVLNPGDLTAEEAEQEKERLEKEVESAPADLNSRILFKAPEKKSEKPTTAKRSSVEENKKSKKLKTKQLLSFDDEEDNDDN